MRLPPSDYGKLINELEGVETLVGPLSFEFQDVSSRIHMHSLQVEPVVLFGKGDPTFPRNPDSQQGPAPVFSQSETLAVAEGAARARHLQPKVGLKSF